MKLQLDFQLPNSSVKIKHGDAVVLLGSCFSDNLAPKFENAGFHVSSNPLGTIFHPLALANLINASLSEFEEFSLNRDDLWFDWRASSTIFGNSEVSLNDLMQRKLEELKKNLSKAKLLVVTFGTAWGYHLNDGNIVANCHKMPSSSFVKSISEIEEMKSQWKHTLDRLKELNPELNVVFTVSPVRHSKDGLIENNRSKARLIQLCESFEHYFPSYELVIDVLRDHRFFEKDLVHPNSQAIDFIWEHAKEFFFSEETGKLAMEVEKVNQMRGHRSIHPDSKASKEFTQKTVDKMKRLSKEFPEVYWR